MIEYYYDLKNYQTAYDCIKKMNDKGIILTPYLDLEMVKNLFCNWIKFIN